MARRIFCLLAAAALQAALTTALDARHRREPDRRLDGVVRDVTGGALGAATVTASDQATAESRETTTNADGTYSIALPAGVYTVTVSAQGFRSGRGIVRLDAAATATLDFTLDTQLAEAVTVTATKREQALFDVPFPVAAPTEQTLRARGVDSLEGIAANVGGLTVQNLGPGQSQVAMRGVSAGQIVRDQPGVKEQVGIYLDESIVSLSLFTQRFSVTGGLRVYSFSEDKAQFFDGLFGNDDNGTALVSQPGSTDATGVAPRLIASYRLADDVRLNAQVSRGFRLGGINDPLNVPVCSVADLATFGGRDTWSDEKVWNYEAGVKARMRRAGATLGASVFYLDISDLQATVTAGSCSSRVVFNVPSARSTGFEAEFNAAPTSHIDVSASATVTDAELRSTLTSTNASGVVSVVSFGANTIGGPLTQAVFTFDPKLPAYDLLNVRAGVRREGWDISVFVDNVTDERALLSLDQERGARARVGFLTNPPRTFGVTTRVGF